MTPHLGDEFFPEPHVALPAMPLCEHVVEDYVTTGLSLKQHPVQFFREHLAALGAIRNAQLRDDTLLQNSTVTVAGPRSGAAAAGHIERCRVHDARRRDRHRQYHRLAEGLCKKPPHGDDIARFWPCAAGCSARALSSMWLRKALSIFPRNCRGCATATFSRRNFREARVPNPKRCRCAAATSIEPFPEDHPGASHVRPRQTSPMMSRKSNST